jgi:hypothetical protein
MVLVWGLKITFALVMCSIDVVAVLAGTPSMSGQLAPPLQHTTTSPSMTSPPLFLGNMIWQW